GRAGDQRPRLKSPTFRRASLTTESICAEMAVDTTASLSSVVVVGAADTRPPGKAGTCTFGLGGPVEARAGRVGAGAGVALLDGGTGAIAVGCSVVAGLVFSPAAGFGSCLTSTCVPSARSARVGVSTSAFAATLPMISTVRVPLTPTVTGTRCARPDSTTWTKLPLTASLGTTIAEAFSRKIML